MRKLVILLFLSLCFVNASAQDKTVKKAVESTFTIVASDAKGNELARSKGVFISSDGCAISPWTPFKGAASVKIVDSKGRERQVASLIGADELYDLAKFRVEGSATPLSMAQQVGQGSQVWILGSTITKANVNKVETFKDKYHYYVLGTAAGADCEGAAVVTADGKLMGVFHKSATDASTTDAAYPNSFSPVGLTVNDPVLRECSLPVELPDKESDAQVALMLAPQVSPANYLWTADRFITKFPTENDGYNAKGGILANQGDFAGAKRTLEEGIAKATNKAEAHFNLARIAYQSTASGRDSLKVFSMDEADAEADKAIAISDMPLYRHLKAQIKYYRGQYQDAYNDFLALTKTNLRNPELYLEMAQSKERLNAPQAEVLALLDSCVALCDTPYVASSAPYFLARATQYNNMGEYRKAMVDYTMYEYFNRGRLGANFYFTRGECEMKGRIYQAALNDITAACILDRTNPIYLAVKGNLHLKVGQYDDAIEAAERCLKLEPDNADGLLILGLAQCQKGNKTEGVANLEKAKAAGNPQADTYIKKFGG